MLKFFLIVVLSAGTCLLPLTAQSTDLGQMRTLLEEMRVEDLSRQLLPFIEQKRAAGQRDVELATALELAGGLDYLRTDYYQGLEKLDTALRILEQYPDSLRQRAAVELTRARIFESFPHYDQAYRAVDRAIGYLDQAIKAGQTVPNDLVVYCYAIKALTVATMGDQEEALLLLEKAGQYPEEELLLRTRGVLNYARATTFTNFEMFDTLEVVQQTFLKKVEREGDLFSQSAALGNLGITLSSLGRYAEGEAYFRRSTRILRQLLRESENRNLYGNLAANTFNSMDADLKQGRLTRVDSLLVQAQAYSTALFGQPGGTHMAAMYGKAAAAYSRAGREVAADSLLRLAVQSAAGYNVSPGEAKLPRLTANLMLDLFFLETLLRKQEVELRRSGGRGLDEAVRTGTLIDTITSAREARMSLRQSLGLHQEWASANLNEFIEGAVLHYQRSGDAAYLDRAYSRVAGRKGRLLRGYLESPYLAERLDVPAQLLDRQQSLRLELSQLERRLEQQGESAELTNAMVDLSERIYRLEDSLSANYPAYYRAIVQQMPADWRQTSINDRSVILEYHLGRDSIYCFRIREGRHLSLHSAPLAVDLERRLGQTLTDPEVAAACYQELVAPAMEGIAPGTPITIIPDGDLWRLSFAALRNGDRFLIEDHPVAYAYSLSTLRTAGEFRNSGGGQYAGFGIDYAEENEQVLASLRSGENAVLGTLLNTVREVRQLSTLFGGSTWTNVAATKQNFLAAAGEAGLLHLALHGSLDRDPFDSGLIFSGEADDNQPFEKLTMGEVLRNRVSAELTILSACHSGNGPLETNDGPQSIARAFAFAGSRAVLASNWEANDEVSYQIVTAFGEYLDQGLPKDVALQRATIDFLAQASPLDRDPRNWANFTLAGATDPLPRGRRLWGWGIGALLAVTVLGWLYYKK